MDQINYSQDLRNYSVPVHYSLGSSKFMFALWLLLGRPLLNSYIPGTFWRKSLLRMFGAQVGVGGRIKTRINITFPWKLKIGNYCWIGENVWIDNIDFIKISDRSCISQGAYLCTGNHDYKSDKFNLISKPILIESDSWIGAYSRIAPGTIVGKGVVVSFGSVVSGNLPSFKIVKGNPAIIVGERKIKY